MRSCAAASRLLKMESSSYRYLSLAFLLLAIHTIHTSEAQACPEPQSKPLETRAKEAANIIYGTVTGIHQGTNPEEYIVEMDVKCVLKGTATPGKGNITEVGTDCVDNGMRKGISYIVFVHVLRDGQGRNRYVTHDINTELAANKATKENFDLIRKAGVDDPCNQVTVYQSPNAEPDGRGQPNAGPNGAKPAQERCVGNNCGNAGNVVIAGSLWMLSALICTVLTHWNIAT